MTLNNEHPYSSLEELIGLVIRAQTRGLLIGDFEKERLARESAGDLSGYREYGTPYPYGREIHGLIDTVHFFTHIRADCFN